MHADNQVDKWGHARWVQSIDERACKQEGRMGDEEEGGGGGSDLSKAKVSQLDKALQVYEDVLRLEVPVHDVVVVEVL